LRNRNKMKTYLLALLLVSMLTGLYARDGRDTINLADPTIFHEGNMYYLYGTGSQNGFDVYTSKDLKEWHLETKKALSKGDSYGNRAFWAPQAFTYHGKYYLAYAADEHIAIAQGDSPLGPFKQTLSKAISGQGKQIDPFIFKDIDGKLYLYYVRLQDGNRIFVARLKDDLTDIKESTVTECLHSEGGWENTAYSKWPVTEGPTVIRISNTYYLFYSANDFRNMDYAVGYATSSSPTGPWKKYAANPILSRQNTGRNGSGHGDVFSDDNGRLAYVFHVHSSNSRVESRKTALINLNISRDSVPVISVIPATLKLLEGVSAARHQ
jgi:xylan 1,4-beta-xylosidase